MRKILLSIGGLFVVGALLVGFTPVEEQATVMRTTGIAWFDGNGTLTFVPDANVQFVFTNNGNGNATIRAFGTLPVGAALPDRALQFTDESTGVICGFGIVDFTGTTTPSGQFSVTCHGP